MFGCDRSLATSPAHSSRSVSQSRPGSSTTLMLPVLKLNFVDPPDVGDAGESDTIDCDRDSNTVGCCRLGVSGTESWLRSAGDAGGDMAGDSARDTRRTLSTFGLDCDASSRNLSGCVSGYDKGCRRRLVRYGFLACGEKDSAVGWDSGAVESRAGDSSTVCSCAHACMSEVTTDSSPLFLVGSLAWNWIDAPLYDTHVASINADGFVHSEFTCSAFRTGVRTAGDSARRMLPRRSAAAIRARRTMKVAADATVNVPSWLVAVFNSLLMAAAQSGPGAIGEIARTPRWTPPGTVPRWTSDVCEDEMADNKLAKAADVSGSGCGFRSVNRTSALVSIGIDRRAISVLIDR